MSTVPYFNSLCTRLFVSEWGPGPSIEKAFESSCNCDLQFKTDDVLPRIILEGERTEADVVIGLNTDITKKARETGLFEAHGQDKTQLTLPIDWTDNIFFTFQLWSYRIYLQY